MEEVNAAIRDAFPEEPGDAAPAATQPDQPGLELLAEVELPVSVSFGKTRLPLKDLLKLTIGSTVELNRNVDDAVELLINNRVIARGEVVVIEGNYGIRIQELTRREEAHS